MPAAVEAYNEAYVLRTRDANVLGRLNCRGPFSSWVISDESWMKPEILLMYT